MKITSIQYLKSLFVYKLPEGTEMILSLFPQLLSESSDTYDESLHFPIMMRLKKTRLLPGSRDVTPESR